MSGYSLPGLGGLRIRSKNRPKSILRGFFGIFSKRGKSAGDHESTKLADATGFMPSGFGA